MLNDRDDKFEGHDDSEYHFSDDEVSYELEPESPKQPAPGGGPTGGSGKDKLMKIWSERKRPIIVGVVVIALIFVFYKVLSPSAPSTDISAVPAVAQNNTPSMNNAAGAGNQNAGFITATTNQPVTQTAAMTTPAQTTAPIGQPMQTAAQPVTQPVVNPMMPNNQQAAMAQPMQQPAQTYPSVPVAQAQQPMPAVVTVDQPYQQQAPAYNQLPPSAESAASGLNSQTSMAMTQMRNEYVQKMNDFITQNKALQDQVQTLNARVSTLESELTQMVHVMTRQYQNQNQNQNQNQYQNNGYQNSSSYAVPSGQLAQPTAAAEQPRSSAYNVQAIIPGRAWLKAENGETLTVAEGDNIKDLGRVTKIDPYDGVVEVNTGSKVISLAYGNGSSGG